MKCQGVDAETLPLAKQSDHIFRNKIVDIDTPEQRLVQFHAFFDDERHVISGIYHKRRELMQLKINKKHEQARW